ncbi:MAG: hypothetical protein LBC99_08160 [Spirochaetota bacterium]|jgi:DNA-directed RNA polymerase subunit K/omega|nr:hypothetical protein [Spirochaetota bacterium]
MALPFENLLNRNENRYEMCVAAMKILQHIATTTSSEDISKMRDKLAVAAISRLLDEKIPIKRGVQDVTQDPLQI